jgi:hypothetical protein
VLLASASGALAIALLSPLVLAGLDLVVTGALGHCPLYHKLGHMSPSTEARMNALGTQKADQGQQHGGHGGHGGHGWMMMICCVPMLVIAIVLVATGVASSSFIFTQSRAP